MLAGDCDFSANLKAFKDCRYNTMILHCGTLSPGYSTHADVVSNKWPHVVASANGGKVQHPGNKLILAKPPRENQVFLQNVPDLGAKEAIETALVSALNKGLSPINPTWKVGSTCMNLKYDHETKEFRSFGFLTCSSPAMATALVSMKKLTVGSDLMNLKKVVKPKEANHGDLHPPAAKCSLRAFHAGDGSLAASAVAVAAATAAGTTPTGVIHDLDVPVGKRCHLIGTGGINYKRLRADFPSVKIVVPKDPKDPSPVTIAGADAAAIRACMHAMANMIQFPVQFRKDVFEEKIILHTPLHADVVNRDLLADFNRHPAITHVSLDGQDLAFRSNSAKGLATAKATVIAGINQIAEETFEACLPRASFSEITKMCRSKQLCFHAKQQDGTSNDAVVTLFGIGGDISRVKAEILRQQIKTMTLFNGKDDGVMRRFFEDTQDELAQQHNVKINTTFDRTSAMAPCVQIDGHPEDVRAAVASIQTKTVTVSDPAKHRRGLLATVLAEIATLQSTISCLWFNVTTGKGEKARTVTGRSDLERLPAGKPLIGDLVCTIVASDPNGTAQIKAAKEAIERLVREYTERVLPFHDGTTGGLETKEQRELFCEDNDLVDIAYLQSNVAKLPMIPERKFGLIIGAGHATEIELKQRHNCKIFFYKAGDSRGKGITVISKSAKNTWDCVKDIGDIVKMPLQQASLLIAGTSLSLDNAEAALQSLLAGARPHVERIAWPEHSPWVKSLFYKGKSAPLVQQLYSQLNALAIQNVTIIVGKGADFVRVQGPEADVGTTVAAARRHIEAFEQQIVKVPVTATPQEIKFLLLGKGNPTLRWEEDKMAKDGKGPVIFVRRRPSNNTPPPPTRKRAQIPSNQMPAVKQLSGTFKFVNFELDFEVWQGNIMDQALGVDAITNAANENLQHAGGIAGHISNAAGSGLLAAESKAVLRNQTSRSVPPGTACITSSCNLASTTSIMHIVHTVAPQFLQGSLVCPQVYKDAVKAALTKASDAGVQALAIPLIGSGIFGWNVQTTNVSTLFVQGLLEWFADNSATSSIAKVVIVDVSQPAVMAVCNKLRAARASQLVQPDIPAPAKSIKQCQWSWKDDNGWMIYDADQNEQIERAYHEYCHGKSTPKVTLCGDKAGVMSDSKHKPDGALAAIYEVAFSTMKQVNTTSKFERDVKRKKAPHLRDIVLSAGGSAAAAAPKSQPLTPTVAIAFTSLGGGGSKSGKSAAAAAPSGGFFSSIGKTFSSLNPFGKEPKEAEKDDGKMPDTPTASGAAGRVAAGVTATASSGGSTSVGRSRAPASTAGIVCYALDAADGQAAVQSMEKWVRDSWITSEPIRAGCDVPFTDTIVPAVKQVAAKSNCSIVDIDRADCTFKVKALGKRHLDSSKTAIIEAVLLESATFKESQSMPPSTWVPNQPNPVDAYDVAQDSAEWQDVKARFNTHGFGATIVKLERIQHKDVWREYARQRAITAESLDGDPNELLDLKHGTGSTDPKQVYGSDKGIDYRYSDWGMYGKGAYFAEDPDYTHSKGYTFDAGGGNNAMLLCRILAGKVDERTSDSNIRHPTVRHHSVRGIVSGRQYAYILYEHYRCYPEYLVTYRK